MTVMKNNSKVLKDPAPLVATDELADSSVNLVVRPWVKTDDYWPIKRELTQQLKEAFDKEGISIPFPQRDIHLFQNK
jgi:small conductance mechanosensitive channel